MKVFSIKMELVSKSKFNTNVLKASVSKLLSIGKSCMVINSKLTPVIPSSNPIMSYLLNKSQCKFYNCEMIILAKENNFPDGELISGKSLENKLTDSIPFLCEKKTGESLELDLLSVKCRKM